MPKQDYTLISFIGAHYGEGYDTTEYTFFPGKENEERIVSNDTSLAIISAKKQHWRIVRAIIIGTYTSKWSELVSSADSDLKSRIDAVPMNDENEDLRKELETYLSKKYKTEFRLIAHTDHIDDDSIEGLSLFYNSDVFSELKNDTGYLVDITHSFRTMPILLFQTLQQHMPAFNENKSIELIYGEQGIDKKHSVFRDLGKFWDAYKLTAALNLFRYSFDGRGLVPYLEQAGYKKAAEWVSFFSSAVKSDYLMPVWKSLKLLNEAIKELSADPGLAWVIETRSIRQRGLYTQAVIAYEAAVETRMAVYKARKEGTKQYKYIGKYSLWLDSKESSGLRNLLKNGLPRGGTSGFLQKLLPPVSGNTAHLLDSIRKCTGTERISERCIRVLSLLQSICAGFTRLLNRVKDRERHTRRACDGGIGQQISCHHSKVRDTFLGR